MKNTCKHIFLKVIRNHGVYYIKCSKCGYKIEMIGVQTYEEAEQYRQDQNTRYSKNDRTESV